MSVAIILHPGQKPARPTFSHQCNLNWNKNLYPFDENRQALFYLGNMETIVQSALSLKRKCMNLCDR